jgi:lycopene cyclase CruP
LYHNNIDVPPCLLAACSTTGMQYWWEKFPAQGGAATTTYMFTFTDPAPSHVGLLSTMAGQYLQQLPQYLAEPTSSTAGAGADKEAGQGSVPPLERLLVGFVPCYDGSVAPAADRVLPVGDSAANRSTLSLAGFCALVRHLPRLVGGIREALDAGALTAQVREERVGQGDNWMAWFCICLVVGM